MDEGVALLEAAGVVLIVVAPGQVVVAGFARNLARAAKALTAVRARLLIAHGSEWLDVEPTARFLRSEGRTAWAIGDAMIDIDLQPLPGLDFGALLLDAPPPEEHEDGLPWACAADRARIADARAKGRPQPRRR